MKYATFAALIAAVAAEQTCHFNEVSWTIYSDKNCKKVDKKAQAKFGKVKKEDRHLWSGDCEVVEAPEMDLGFKAHCDADGLHQSAWKNTDCKGKPAFDNSYGWDTCEKTKTDKTHYIKV